MSRTLGKPKLPRINLHDQVLLEMAAQGATPNEMEERTGIEASQCVLRVKRVLSSTDVWNDIENRKLAIYELQQILAKVMPMLDTMSEKNTGPIVTSLTHVIESMQAIRDREKEISQKEIEQATEAQARQLLRLFEMGTKRALSILDHYHPEIDHDVIEDALEQGVKEAAELVDLDTAHAGS